jgi:hypothetical protein
MIGLGPVFPNNCANISFLKAFLAIALLFDPIEPWAVRDVPYNLDFIFSTVFFHCVGFVDRSIIQKNFNLAIAALLSDRFQKFEEVR